ncbi:hypothetical protein GCM10023085_44690 [Actinomadura viridis]|uniref:Uncharacterized protein n=1 Tax=Actinomadura viridis TaxID=58110 RepID=A0A931DGV1_9ACTN|nr:hypothetical protein [Actinomadura viridis]MBG6089830.1 hypothetical protein [Actinomadura viridis]
MNGAEWGALVIGGVGAATGIGSLVVATVAVRYAKRSAHHAGRSALHAGESAAEARHLREIEADRRAEEKEYRHEELAPNLPSAIDAAFKRDVNGGALYGSITLDRQYRVRAFGCAGESLTELALSSITPLNEAMEFVIEAWAPGQVRPRLVEIIFKFWPPVEGSGHQQVWSCGCGRPNGDSLGGDGHWERRVKVSYYSPENNVW